MEAKGIFTEKALAQGRPPQGHTHKKCRKCGAIKLIDDFGRQRRMKDGRRNYCKTCITKMRTENKRANREREREYQRHLRKQPHIQEQRADYQRIYRWKKSKEKSNVEV